MESFFLHKFSFDRNANEVWIASLDEQDVTQNLEIRRQMCHILNVHHLWASRLVGTPVLSDDWDDLPFYAWEKLNAENFLLIERFLNNESIEKQIAYKTSDGESCEMPASDILYHILQHSTHHRAVINSLLRQQDLQPVEFNYIAEI